MRRRPQVDQFGVLQSEAEREHGFDDTAQALNEQIVTAGEDRQMEGEISGIEPGRIRRGPGHSMVSGPHRFDIVRGRALGGQARGRTLVPARCRAWTNPLAVKTFIASRIAVRRA